MRSGHRLISALSLLAVAAGTLNYSLPAQAQLRRAQRITAHVPGSMGIPQPEPRITYEAQKKSLGRVLYDIILKQTPYKYQVKADPGNELFNVSARNQPLSVVLRSILAQDKSLEPLVFDFRMSPTGEGTFEFHREFLEVGNIEGEYRVSVANGRVTSVLPLVFKQMGVKYRIEPDVPPVLISLQLRPKDWETALPAVVLEAFKKEPTLTYSLSGDTYVVHLQKNPTTVASYIPEGGKPIRRVKLALTRTPLREALTQLFEGSDWRFEVADGVKDAMVTYAVASEPEFGALTGILRQVSSSGAPVTYREGKGIVYIEPGPLPGQSVARVDANSEPTTSLSVNQRPLHMVLRQLEAPLKVKIEIAKNIPDVPVSFNLENGTIDEFLKAIVQSARTSLPTLVFKLKEEGVYSLELGAGK